MLAMLARKIFEQTLWRIDAEAAVRRAVRRQGARLSIFENVFDPAENFPVYVAALGKAAYPMAVGFHEIAGSLVKGGVVSGVIAENAGQELPAKWQIFAGGHPLPNEASLAAARACLKMLDKAEAEGALVVFLISGGGSAMMELPADARISLADLREFNRMLVTSGAAIAEINAVRRAVSLVKGGGLARRAPNAVQISLIISDTSAGDLTSVASGPSLPPAEDLPEALAVVEKYGLGSKMPPPIMRLLENLPKLSPDKKTDNRAYVLLDNQGMLREAAEIAGKMGFLVKIDDEAEDVLITEGCPKLLSRFVAFRTAAPKDQPVCFLSGGEFGCPVFGAGIGGRNSETVLRLSLAAQNEGSLDEYAILSAGTDGIDGNSPAAGAVADRTTLDRAALQKMDPLEYLTASDSFTFFDALGGALLTGATGTNVRDLRILLAK